MVRVRHFLFVSFSSPFPLPFLFPVSSCTLPFPSPFLFPVLFTFLFPFLFRFLFRSFSFRFPFLFLPLSFSSPFRVLSFPFLYYSFSFSLSSLMWILWSRCESSAWKNDKRKKKITCGKTIWKGSRFLQPPSGFWWNHFQKTHRWGFEGSVPEIFQTGIPDACFREGMSWLSGLFACRCWSRTGSCAEVKSVQRAFTVHTGGDGIVTWGNSSGGGRLWW